MLGQLGLRDWVVEHGVTTDRWRASIGGRLVKVDLPPGTAISRESLDTRMLAAAEDAGAEVCMSREARIIDVGPGRVIVSLVNRDASEKREFGAVVVASGLHASGLQSAPSWNEKPNGPFGAMFCGHSDSIEPGVIYMACDDDGYVGMVKLESDLVDVAAALVSGSRATERGTPQQRIDAILQRSSFPPSNLRDRTPVLTTPPLRRSRRAPCGPILMIGDAAGYVEPFTGEGMTWGMQSGIAAADRIAASISNLAKVSEHWDRELENLLSAKRRRCRAVTTMLRWPWARLVVGTTLARWPSVAGPLVRSLNRA